MMIAVEVLVCRRVAVSFYETSSGVDFFLWEHCKCWLQRDGLVKTN